MKLRGTASIPTKTLTGYKQHFGMKFKFEDVEMTIDENEAI